MNIAMLRPNVVVDPGLRLDDRAAGRIVDRMLDALDYDLDRADEVFKAHEYANGAVAPLGNPKGQARFVQQFIKSTGKALLNMPDVTFGKRKRFALYFDMFDVRRDGLGRRWLMLEQLGITCQGVAHRIENRRSPLLMITHHALVRMVQRANCATPEDLLEMLRRSTSLALLAGWASEGSKLLPEGSKSGWLIPAYPIGGDKDTASWMDLVYLVLRKGRHDGEDFSIPVVPTVLDASMIQDWETLRPLMMAMDRVQESPIEVTQEIWRAGFQATTKATRMGRREA